MKNSLINIFKDFDEIFIFIGFLFFGTFTKIFFAKERGKKITTAYIISEFIVSGFIGASCYFINEEYLKLSHIIAFVICGWTCSMSTIIHHKLEELLISAFDNFKQKFTDQNTK